jgi:hypothetical protein
MRISALILGTLFAVGCSSAANKKLDEFADRACACKDAECGQAVMKDFLAWAKDNENARGDESKAEASMKRMQDCITKMTSKMIKTGDGLKDTAPKAPADKAE